MHNNPLNKVVFIQKVAAFIEPDSLKDLFRLAYVSDSWNDTIKNYAFHLFEKKFLDVGSVDIFEKVCRSVIRSRVIWFVDVLSSSKTVRNRINLPRLVCTHNASSVIMMQLVCDKFVEADGKELLRSHLVATDCSGFDARDLNSGLTSLMVAVNEYSSPEVMEVLFGKISEVGGNDVLKSQLSASTTNIHHNGSTCLMLNCSHSRSSEVMKLVFEKILEAGGKALLRSQVCATNLFGQSCLMMGCGYSASSEVVKLVFDKIVEAGGKDLLRSHLVATDCSGFNCLMLACKNPTMASPKIIKLLFERLVDVGGTELLNSQLIATSKSGLTCLMFGCKNHNSPTEVMKLVIEKIFEVGGPDLLQRQLMATNNEGWTCLVICSHRDFNFKTPEAVKLLTVVLFELDLFKLQYAKLVDEDKETLREKAEIKDASCVPDPASIAEVKAILQTTVDCAAAKKKQ